MVHVWKPCFLHGPLTEAIDLPSFKEIIYLDVWNFYLILNCPAILYTEGTRLYDLDYKKWTTRSIILIIPFIILCVGPDRPKIGE